ncbi:MAG: hypothetical protein ABIZ09_06585 [Rhodoferax sp.]
MTRSIASCPTPFQLLASLPAARKALEGKGKDKGKGKPGSVGGSPQTLAASLEVHACSLTVLRRLMRVVTDVNLRNFLCEVFNEKALRDRVLLDVPDRVSGLVLRMQSAAHRAYKQSKSNVHTTEALYCATLVARLPEILAVRDLHLGAMPGYRSAGTNAFDAHLDDAITNLQQFDNRSALLMRWVVASPRRAKRLGDLQQDYHRDHTTAEVDETVAWAVTQVQLVWIQTLAMDPELEAPPFIRIQA